MKEPTKTERPTSKDEGLWVKGFALILIMVVPPSFLMGVYKIGNAPNLLFKDKLLGAFALSLVVGLMAWVGWMCLRKSDD